MPILTWALTYFDQFICFTGYSGIIWLDFSILYACYLGYECYTSFSIELWPMICIKILFLQNILAINGWISCKLCVCLSIVSGTIGIFALFAMKLWLLIDIKKMFLGNGKDGISIYFCICFDFDTFLVWDCLVWDFFLFIAILICLQPGSHQFSILFQWNI